MKAENEPTTIALSGVDQASWKHTKAPDPSKPLQKFGVIRSLLESFHLITNTLDVMSICSDRGAVPVTSHTNSKILLLDNAVSP